MLFEVIVDQPRGRCTTAAPDASAAIAETTKSIAATSALQWGEHCTDCAFPACYSHCSLYTPRADLKCRRFVDGVVPVTVAADQDGTVLGDGMRIGFRQWGKLEAAGRVELRRRGWVAGKRSADDAVRALLRSDLPWAARRRASRVWPRASRAMTRPGMALRVDDVFLIEAINEGAESVPFTVTIIDDSSTSRFYQHGFVLTPGYNRVVVPNSAISAHVDLTREIIVSIEPTAVPPGNSFVFTRADWVRPTAPLHVAPADASWQAPVQPTVTPAVSSAGGGVAKVKCVVWDLDDTLWRGTLVEDGPDRLVPRTEVVELVQALDARGILQSVASKNDPDEALLLLERHDLSKYFLHPQIGWGPKSNSVARIAESLDIGIDTVLFVDDQPFERAEVQATQPAVRVVDAADVATLLQRADLDVPITGESRRRRLLYREESHRRQALEQAPGAFEEFLRSCDIRLTLSAPSTATAERIYELGQRTNQLNYSGRRLERTDVDALVSDDAATAGIVLSAVDRFGDYGIIGFVTVDRRTFTVTNFFMSCRVQRKMLEHAFFAALLAAAAQSGFDVLRIRHRPTARNKPAVEVLQSLGATPVETPTAVEREVVYVLPCSQPPADSDVVAVQDDVLSTWAEA